MWGVGFGVWGLGFRFRVWRSRVRVKGVSLGSRFSGFGFACGRCTSGSRKVDVRLPGKGNSNSHGSRPVHSNHLDDKVDSDQ